jgi:hypothetical protein
MDATVSFGRNITRLECVASCPASLYPLLSSIRTFRRRKLSSCSRTFEMPAPRPRVRMVDVCIFTLKKSFIFYVFMSSLNCSIRFARLAQPGEEFGVLGPGEEFGVLLMICVCSCHRHLYLYHQPLHVLPLRAQGPRSWMKPEAPVKKIPIGSPITISEWT